MCSKFPWTANFELLRKDTAPRVAKPHSMRRERVHQTGRTYGLMLLNERLFALLRVTFSVSHSERSEESQTALYDSNSSTEGTAPRVAKPHSMRCERVHQTGRIHGLMLLNERLFALLRVTFSVSHSERSEESQTALMYMIQTVPRKELRRAQRSRIQCGASVYIKPAGCTV